MASFSPSQFDTRCAELLLRGAFPVQERVTVLVLGGGGREHAIAQALVSSAAAKVKTVLVSPGNSGTALMGLPALTPGPGGASRSRRKAGAVVVMNMPQMCVADTAVFARRCGVALVVVGPEQPLVEGVADTLKQQVLYL